MLITIFNVFVNVVRDSRKKHCDVIIRYLRIWCGCICLLNRLLIL